MLNCTSNLNDVAITWLLYYLLDIRKLFMYLSHNYEENSRPVISIPFSYRCIGI